MGCGAASSLAGSSRSLSRKTSGWRTQLQPGMSVYPSARSSGTGIVESDPQTDVSRLWPQTITRWSGNHSWADDLSRGSGHQSETVPGVMAEYHGGVWASDRSPEPSQGALRRARRYAFRQRKSRHAGQRSAMPDVLCRELQLLRERGVSQHLARVHATLAEHLWGALKVQSPSKLLQRVDVVSVWPWQYGGRTTTRRRLNEDGCRWRAPQDCEELAVNSRMVSPPRIELLQGRQQLTRRLFFCREQVAVIQQ